MSVRISRVPAEKKGALVTPSLRVRLATLGTRQAHVRHTLDTRLHTLDTHHLGSRLGATPTGSPMLDEYTSVSGLFCFTF